ncbi:MAG: hypothetical protein MZV70_13910 [Desulfobacterales bacterium]|nr:hypothetical protein [Desulfobacterales bacterium]
MHDALVLKPAAAGQESASVLSATDKGGHRARDRGPPPMTLDSMALLKMSGEARNGLHRTTSCVALHAKYDRQHARCKGAACAERCSTGSRKRWALALADERMNMTGIEAWMAPYLADLHLLYQQ